MCNSINQAGQNTGQYNCMPQAYMQTSQRPQDSMTSFSPQNFPYQSQSYPERSMLLMTRAVSQLAQTVKMLVGALMGSQVSEPIAPSTESIVPPGTDSAGTEAAGEADNSESGFGLENIFNSLGGIKDGVGDIFGKASDLWKTAKPLVQNGWSFVKDIGSKALGWIGKLF